MDLGVSSAGGSRFTEAAGPQDTTEKRQRGKKEKKKVQLAGNLRGDKESTQDEASLSSERKEQTVVRTKRE